MAKKLKFSCLLIFCAAAIYLVGLDDRTMPVTGAMSSGPPAGFTGAPGENSCSACHQTSNETGQFTVSPPANYTPGQTYQIAVQHQTTDATRLRWGFQLTALAGTSMAGSFANLGGNTQTDSDSGRSYIHHTTAGTFAGQASGASWTFNWTAPATNVGPVTFYAAGNQADNNGNPSGDQIYLTNAVSQPAAAPAARPTFDFDGDGKADVGIYRPGPGEWWYLRSLDGTNRAFQFGSATDKIVPADFTGDSKTDLAFFRPSTGFWYVLRSEDNTFFGFPFGSAGDVPVPGYYDTDGKADAAVYRPSNSTWFITLSAGGSRTEAFGAAGDLPVAADYDGDGKTDLAVFRPAGGSGGGEFWLNMSQAGQRAVAFGTSTDKAVPGDYTGDGKADIAIWRSSNGFWYVIRSEDFTFYGFPFGADGDVPSPGDYDGDGKFDAAVFRQGNPATWFINRSTAGQQIVGFGSAGDIPIASAFVR